jgi:F-type H+-transporting ATPase subunit epsilon
MPTFKLIIISPQKPVLETEAQSVTFFTTEGQITVLPGHMSVFSTMSPGEVIVRGTDGETSLVVGGGFANITHDSVTLLTEFGTRSDDIDQEQVMEAKRRAEEILKEQADTKTSALAQVSLARSLMELKIAQKRRPRH